MAEKKADPTVKGDVVAEFPEGTHPARSASEVTHSAENMQYRDMPDKPDPSTIAQEQVLSGDEAAAK